MPLRVGPFNQSDYEAVVGNLIHPNFNPLNVIWCKEQVKSKSLADSISSYPGLVISNLQGIYGPKPLDMCFVRNDWGNPTHTFMQVTHHPQPGPHHTPPPARPPPHTTDLHRPGRASLADLADCGVPSPTRGDPDFQELRACL